VPFGPNATYELKGTEKFVNSGTILPKGDENDIPGSGNSFSVKFDKAGTYDYTASS
jgi:plastocyanin